MAPPSCHQANKHGDHQLQARIVARYTESSCSIIRQNSVVCRWIRQLQRSLCNWEKRNKGSVSKRSEMPTVDRSNQIRVSIQYLIISLLKRVVAASSALMRPSHFSCQFAHVFLVCRPQRAGSPDCPDGKGAPFFSLSFIHSSQPCLSSLLFSLLFFSFTHQHFSA